MQGNQVVHKAFVSVMVQVILENRAALAVSFEQQLLINRLLSWNQKWFYTLPYLVLIALQFLQKAAGVINIYIIAPG
jgi:hypothetical protein